MTKNINIFFIFRILIGGVFLISSLEKIFNPYQNFLYVIQGYEVFPEKVETFVALTFPWIELLIGLFVFTGFWLKETLLILMVVLAIFISIIAQALLRNLPLEECGCFGSLISLPPSKTLIFDSLLFLMNIAMIRYFSKSLVFSLDGFFFKNRIDQNA